jgi:hypothetical protein
LAYYWVGFRIRSLNGHGTDSNAKVGPAESVER